MSSRYAAFLQKSGLIFAIVLLALWLKPVQASFSNGQNAALVLGQANFTSSTPSTTQNRLANPQDIAVDPSTGKVFVSDAMSNRVLRFRSLEWLQNGGNAEAVLGQTNFTNSSYATSQTRMRSPIGLAIDNAGRLWVADAENHRVLRFDNAATKTNGVAADGVLGQTSFSTRTNDVGINKMDTPNSVAVDSAGRLWVSDTGNNRVLMFHDAATKGNGANADLVLGQATFDDAIPGTAQNMFFSPMGLSLDAAGRLWVVDWLNNRVLRFDDAANKANGANADGVLGQADFDSDGYGVGANSLDMPMDLDIDGKGRLWVADTYNHRVLRFDDAANKANGADADGVLGQADLDSTSYNTTQNTFTSPIGVSVDPSGAVWVADRDNARVLLFTTQSITFNTLSNKSIADSPITVSATASSGLPVSFNTSTPAVCTVSGSTVSLIGIGNCTIIASQAGDGTYTAAASVFRAFTVTGVPEITWADPAAITYGTPLSGSQLNATANVAGSFSYNPPASTVLSPGTHTITATFTPSVPNYSTAQKTVSLTVNKAPLEVTVHNSIRTYGNNNPAFAFSYGDFVNGEDDSVLGGSLVITSTATINSPVGTYPIIASGLSSEKYDISYLPGTLTINKAPLTITAQDASRNYGSANPSFSVSYSGFKNNESDSALSGSLVITSTATTSSPVGSYPIVASGLSSSNYAINYINGSLSINKAPLAISAQNASRNYGATNPSLTVNYDGFVLGHDVGELDGTLVITTTADTSSPVGSYPIVASGLSSTNYDISYTQGVLTVNKVPFLITIHNSQRLYGNNNPAFAFSYDDFVNGEDDSVFGGSLTITSTATINSPVGTYPIVASGLSSNNYDIQYTAGTLTVNKAPLNITAQNASRIYGEANPSFDVSYSGFKNSEDKAVLGGTLVITTTADASSPVGSYSIVPSGLSSANYNITFNNGTLTVNTAPLTITAQDASRSYGAANPSFSVSYNGFVNSEDESVLAGALQFTSADSDSPVGSYPIVPSGLSSSNYDISFVNGTLTVNKAPLTITAQNASKLVDTPNPAFSVNYNGFVLSEDENVLDGTLVITSTADLNSPVGSYPIVPSGLTSSNYEIEYVNGTLVIDEALAITWASPAAIGYGTALSTDQLNASANIAGTFSYEPALGTILPAGTHTLTATFTPDDTRYSLASQTILLTVNKAPLTITAQNASRTYGAANPSFAVAYSGFVNGENESVLDGALSFASANANSAVGSYPITPSGLSSSNYEISFVDGSLSVTKAPLTITAQNASRTYGAANPSFAVSYSGFVLGENASVLNGSLQITTTATANSPAGTYPIVPSGLSSSNYEISFVSGTLTIEPQASTQSQIFLPFIQR